MQLTEIDKSRYRRHLNRVILLCIISLAAGSLGISQLLIQLFPADSGSHFHWNLSGVVVSAIGIAYTLNKFRHHPYMKEVVYVWELKQALNKISRKMAKIKPLAQQGNVDALITLQFCYAGSRQLWMLDDNTITMDELAIQQAELDSQAATYKLTLDPADYKESMLCQF